MRSSRVALSAIFILSSTASLAVYISWHPHRTHAFDCSPRDASRTIETDNCGGAEWDLAASYGGEGYDEGDWSAAGACSTTYTDCNCNFHSLGNHAASRSDIQAEDDGPDGYGGEWYTWWWNLYGYSGWNEPSCTSGACQGFDYVQSATPIPENYYEAGYDMEDGDCAE